MQKGMNPRAMNTSTVGCASVMLSSQTSAASVSKLNETPAAETPLPFGRRDVFDVRDLPERIRQFLIRQDHGRINENR